MMPSHWREADSAKAKEIWVEYQQQHDLSDRIGQTVGIDPTSGRIWFGESTREIVLQREAAGLDFPLFFERVGSEAYFRTGNRRCFWGPFRLMECQHPDHDDDKGSEAQFDFSQEVLHMLYVQEIP